MADDMKRAAVLLLLAACAAPAPDPRDTVVLRLDRIEAAADGRCYARTDAQMRTERIASTEVVRPARRDETGAVIEPRVVRSVMREVTVPVTQGQRFEAVCPPDLSSALVKSLQRALSVRGLYNGFATGTYDTATQAAVQAVQRERGLDSSLLAVETAQSFGLAPVPRAPQP